MWKVLIMCLVSKAFAFTPKYASLTCPASTTVIQQWQQHPVDLRCAATSPRRQYTMLFAEESQQPTETFEKSAESGSSSSVVSREPTEVTIPRATPAATTPPAGSSDDSKKYPINVPSPILLASSMVLAISGTGSLFELLGGDPKLGFAPTAAIALVGLPMCLFLFYASVLKAQAETEEDDKKFMSGRK